jgi:ankyrin repeat protein
MLAAGTNTNPEVVTLLLKSGADAKAKDQNGKTALERAQLNAKLKESDVYQRLLEMSQGGQTFALFDLAMKGTPQQVQAAIARGADVNAVSHNDYMTPIILAACHNPNPDVVVALVKAGADVNAQDISGRTALMYCAKLHKSEVIRILLEAGAKVNIQAHDGWTALMSAAYSNRYPEVITVLLKAGANAKAKDLSGRVALTILKGNPWLRKTDAFRQLQEATESKQE